MDREEIYQRVDWLNEMIDDLVVAINDIENPNVLVYRSPSERHEDNRHAKRLRIALCYLECQHDELIGRLPEMRCSKEIVTT